VAVGRQRTGLEDSDRPTRPGTRAGPSLKNSLFESYPLRGTKDNTVMATFNGRLSTEIRLLLLGLGTPSEL